MMFYPNIRRLISIKENTEVYNVLTNELQKKNNNNINK